MAIEVEAGVALAPRTTLELGGAAAHFVCARSEADVIEALAWADARGLAVRVLGGGSNLIIADAGFSGLVLDMAIEGAREVEAEPGAVALEVGAGESWDRFVSSTVERGLAGVECLGGIPGRVGATPIQNVGAYGQEVCESIALVRAFDREAGAVVTLRPEDCAFGYRDSALKRAPERFVVLAVTFALRPGGAPAVRYAELERTVGAAPSLSEVHRTVVELRRSKSMVLDPADPNRRSAGSFFTNPIVPSTKAQRVFELAVDRGVVERESDVPRWPQPGGKVKLAAGWLVERAGMSKGMRRGAVGISSRHALALVHHGGGTTAALLALAEEVSSAVVERFGVTLVREPVLWG